jgi:hypothetical protein
VITSRGYDCYEPPSTPRRDHSEEPDVVETPKKDIELEFNVPPEGLDPAALIDCMAERLRMCTEAAVA